MLSDNHGTLFIVAAPSGGGKTSLVKKLINDVSSIEVSVSHTTRDMRPGETNGVDYFFTTDLDFQKLIEQQAFVEHACVFNHFYGTSFHQINERLSTGIDVVLDIDWQGAQQIKQAFSSAVSIFVIPPSLAVLKQRLQDRRQDNDDVIENRMKRARDEMSHYSEFDYLIVNDEFDAAAAQLQAIVISNRLRVARQTIQQRNLLSFLLSSTI